MTATKKLCHLVYVGTRGSKTYIVIAVFLIKSKADEFVMEYNKNRGFWDKARVDDDSVVLFS